MSDKVYRLAMQSRPFQVAEDGTGRIFPKWRVKNEFLGDLVIQLSIFDCFFSSFEDYDTYVFLWEPVDTEEML